MSKASREFLEAFGEPLVPEDRFAEFRQENGRFQPGTRGKVKKLTAQGLGRALRRALKSKFGSERVYYEWLIDMAADTETPPVVRRQCIEDLANRIDGKVLNALEISTPVGKPVEVKDATPGALSTPERLAAVARILAGTGALPQPGAAGGAGAGAYAEMEQVPGQNPRGEG